MNQMERPDRFETARRVRDPGETALASLIALFATLVGLVLLAWTILYVTKGRFLKRPFEKVASRALDRQVNVAGDFQLYLDPLNIHFVAQGLSITNPNWAKQPYFLKSRNIDSRIATLPLIGGTHRANWLALIGGDLDFEWDAAHKRNTWTFGTDKPGKPFEMPQIRRALIDGTRIHFSDPHMQLVADLRIDTVRAQNTKVGGDVRFHGDGTLRGKPFTVTGRLESPNQTIAGGQNRLALHAQSDGTVLDVNGTLPGFTELEGSDLHLAIRGPDMEDAFEFLGAAVPHSRAWRMTSALTKHDDEWRLTGIRGVVGDSDFAGRITVSTAKPRLHIGATLVTRSLDIVDAGAWVGYDPNRLAAEGKNGAITRVGGTPHVLPDAPLQVDKLGNFDADLDYRVTDVKGKFLPVSNVAMKLKLDNKLLTFRPLAFDIAGGHLTSDIAIDARRQPVRTGYDIRLSPTPMGKLLAGFGVSEAGTTGTIKARIRMTGFGDTVRKSLATSSGRIAVILPQGTMWIRNTELSELDIGTFVQKMFQKELKEPVQINCGLIAFTVRNGVAAADPILIDTARNVVTGRGGFSFKTEAIDLAVRADAKNFSLFSGQSPVGIKGYFAAPHLDVISPQLLARAGVGLGLAAAVSPPALILAFVDIGDAKAAACGPVLAGAHATAQRTGKGKPRDDVGHGTTAKAENGKRSPDERHKQHKKFLGIF